MAEAWFRNPSNYIKELVEVGEGNIAWDRGVIVKRKIDVKKHADLHYGVGIPYRLLLVGLQGTMELGPDNDEKNPVGVYPTWAYGENLAILEDMIENPMGEDHKLCSDLTIPVDERPVLGQEHRVVITDLPDAKTIQGRKLLTILKTLQEDYPNSIIHVHGLYSYRYAFGMGLGAADVEPRTAAQKGKLYFPSGKEEKYERAYQNPQWVLSLGFKPDELAVPRNRCMYNIKSAKWAAANYDSIFNFKFRGAKMPVDTESSDADYKPPTDNRAIVTNKLPVKDGDKMLCNTCSLQNDCKHFREGAVCSLPDAEPKSLATYFKTRDSDMIIDGLGLLVQANTRRLERGMREEEAFGDINPDVSRMVGQVFDQGVKLAKLVDPNLRSGAKVQVNVGAGGGAHVVAMADPKQLVAQCMRTLEAQGFSREEITTDMVKNLLAGMANPEGPRRAIEGELVARDDA